MTDSTQNQPPGPRIVAAFPRTNRSRRMYVPPVLLYILVALMGMLVAVASSYTLRYFGY